MILFLVFLVTVIIGGKLLDILGFRAPWYEKWSLAFLLSSAIQTLGYFNTVQLGVTANSFTYYIFLGILLLLLELISRIKLGLFTPQLSLSPSSQNRWVRNSTRIVWVGIFTLFAITVIYTTYLPVYTTDSIILYDFRAKVIATTGSLSSIRIVPDWAAYPMFTSMVHLFIRLLGYTNPSLFYPLMYLAFAGVFYGAIRPKLSEFKSSLLTLLMYSTPITLWQSKLDGMTNLPYAIFYGISIIYLEKYWKHDKPVWQYAIISALFLGFASWTRHTEPFWAIPVFLIIVSIGFKREVVIPLSYLFIFWYIRRIWPSYTHADYMSLVGATQTIVSNATMASISTGYNLIDTLQMALKFVWRSFNEALNPLIYLCLISTMIDLSWRSLKNQAFYLLVIIGNLLILYISVVFAINTFSYWSGLSNSFTRMISYLSPILWLYLSNTSIWYRIDTWGK